MFDMDVSFRRLRASDLRLMHKWYNTEHVIQWYCKNPQSYEETVAKCMPRITGEEPTRAFLIMYDAIPIGYIQTYRIADYPDYSKYVQADEDTAGLDLFIGEADWLHRGLGSRILRIFLREIVFADSWAKRCIVGPEPLNIVAIKAYEKAGFRYLKTIQLPDEDEPEYLMCVDREAIFPRN